MRQTPLLSVAKVVLGISHDFIPGGFAEALANTIDEENSTETVTFGMYSGSFVDVHHHATFELKWLAEDGRCFQSESVEGLSKNLRSHSADV